MYFLLRYIAKPAFPSRFPVWFGCAYVLLVLGVVIVPASPRVVPPSYIGFFRELQFLGAGFMLFYALLDYLNLRRVMRLTNH
jgi:hypothetical protein